MENNLTLQELLSIQKIAELLQDKPLQEQTLLIAELRQQASKLKVGRDFNKVLKSAEEKNSHDLIVSQKGKEIKDQKGIIKNNAGYYITEMGINYQSFEICPYPMFITERYIDIDDGTEKVKLEYKRDGEWREIILPRAIIANANKIIQLSDIATGITSENAKGVVKYLSDIESVNRYNIRVKMATSRLGWTKFGFVPFVDDIEFTGSDNYAELYNKFHESGNIEVWRAVSNDCLQCTIPKIIVGASYASVLLKAIGVNGFCVHIWGESGRGKTVALMLAASVYGDADPKNGIIRNGKTTSNGIEPVLAFYNDCPVCFDELTTLSQDQITDMIYKFTQGQGKGRMTKNAGLQKSFTWNNVALLSAEKPLADNKTMSGAINRVISIYTDSAIFGDKDMVFIANILKKNYGFGARIFIDSLTEVDVFDIYKKYIKEINLEKYEQKQANAAALILTAYEIAAKYVYKTEEKLSAADIIPYLAEKNTVSISSRAYENIIAWVNANYTYFDESEILQSKWGSYSKDKEDKEKTYVNIFYVRFSDWCCKNGYQEQALLREWRSKNLLKTRSKNEFKNNARVKGELRSDIISLLLPKAESDNDKNKIEQLPIVSDGDHLPF